MTLEWALGELKGFVSATETHYEASSMGGHGVPGSFVTSESEESVLGRAQVVEQILDRIIPAWRPETHMRRGSWNYHRDTATRAIAELVRQDELRENLGDDAPELSASDFHPWIWSGASSLWHSGHFAQAVEGAIRKLNAETQNKVNRRDVSESDLFNQAFSPEAAQSSKSRLRRMPQEDSKTYRSLQRGAMAFAEGIFAGIRNPLAHEDGHDLSEQQALEYLAALSVLARWVDEATVERVDETP
jgi:hypothetical protein